MFCFLCLDCKAGLGRTGSLIGYYLVSEYGFSAAEAIGWLRICRPGCVIGPQQTWLKQQERILRSRKHFDGTIEKEQIIQEGKEEKEDNHSKSSVVDKSLHVKSKSLHLNGLSLHVGQARRSKSSSPLRSISIDHSPSTSGSFNSIHKSTSSTGQPVRRALLPFSATNSKRSLNTPINDLAHKMEWNNRKKTIKKEEKTNG